MATRANDPTTNLYALLADESALQPQAKKTRAAANKAPEQELTPKERAAAKAVQDAERKAKREAAREAERKKQEAEAAIRQRALENAGDNTGFKAQRIQRIKEERTQKATPPPQNAGQEKKSFKGDKKEGKKESKEGWGDNTPSSPATPSAWGTPNQGGDKPNKGDRPNRPFKKDRQGFKGGDRGEGGNREGGNREGGNREGGNREGGNREGGNRRRDMDKHSQSGTSRHFTAKRQGHGQANWGENVPAGLDAAPVQEALASALAPAESTGDDGWGDAPAGDAPTGDAPAGDAPAAEPTKAEPRPDETEEERKEREKEEKQITLEQYEALQAEKQKKLAELVGGRAQPRQLTDDEKNALNKFTVVENAKVTKKAAAPEAKPVKTGAAEKASPAARKGEKPLAVDEVFTVRVARPRNDRPPRGPRDNNNNRPPRDNNQNNRGFTNNNNNRGGKGRGPKSNKPLDSNAFPALGSH